MIKNLLRYVHGDSPKPIHYLIVHFVPFIIAILYRYINLETFSNLSAIQLIFYYFFVWELIGGIFANLLRSTKLFWQEQPLKSKFVYLFLHSVHPILWFLIFNVDIRFGIFYFVYMSLSTIVLLKISDKLLLLLSLFFTFVGLIICNKIENEFNPFPFGLEWIPITYFIKLIFAFTIKYKREDAT